MTCRIWAALLCTALPVAAVQAETSPYFIGASQTFTNESNVLRLENGQPVPARYSSRSDTRSSTALIGGFDQMFGRQRARANVTVRDERYSRNETLDYRGYSASAGLDWQTVGRVSGSVDGSANRNLRFLDTQDRADVGYRGRNLQTVKDLGAAVRLGVVTEYTLEATARRRTVENSERSALGLSRNFDQNSGSLGLRWRPSDALLLGFSAGRAEFDYPEYAPGQPDRSQRDDVAIDGSWRPRGSSVVDFKLAYGRTRYDIDAARNYSGPTGFVNWIWQATGKLRLSTRLARDTGQDSYADLANALVTSSTDYSRTTNLLRIEAQHATTGKISLNAVLWFYDQDLVETRRNVVPPLILTGQHKTTIGSLGARWIPLRSVTVGCDFSQEKRRGSGQLGSDLDSRSVGCFGQFSLQS